LNCLLGCDVTLERRRRKRRQGISQPPAVGQERVQVKMLLTRNVSAGGSAAIVNDREVEDVWETLHSVTKAIGAAESLPRGFDFTRL
jgi:hypothetical protein